MDTISIMSPLPAFRAESGQALTRKPERLVPVWGSCRDRFGLMSFHEAWLAVSGPRKGEQVSDGLRPLLEAVYQQLLAESVDLVTLRRSLVELLTFLGGEGRSNANCWATDLFFAHCEGWERDWAEQNLPEDFHDVLALMGQALHDTVQAPEIAENFGCLPEQLLERLRQAPN